MTLVVMTGGARSGKSSAAEHLARVRHAQGAPVHAAVFGHSAGGDDAEFAERIAKHQAGRPEGFVTREYAGGLGWVESAPTDAVLLVDCLGTLLGRVMEEEWDRVAEPDSLAEADAEQLPDGFEVACIARFDEIVAALSARKGDTIVVTNEVGQGIVPAFASGRLFRDLLGRANRRLIDLADAAYLVVAGRLIDLASLPRQVRWPKD
ncbi:MAG TPA: bifunctional adenosylcobinamide kinase/adenosylcobinamide-phosphate guanylyltransferase [Coriobacteriia bacterium]